MFRNAVTRSYYFFDLEQFGNRLRAAMACKNIRVVFLHLLVVGHNPLGLVNRYQRSLSLWQFCAVLGTSLAVVQEPGGSA